MENLLAECDSTGKFADRSLTGTELENESSVDQQPSAETDSTDHTTQGQEATHSRRQHGRYSLRENVRPPDRLRSTGVTELDYILLNELLDQFSIAVNHIHTDYPV